MVAVAWQKYVYFVLRTNQIRMMRTGDVYFQPLELSLSIFLGPEEDLGNFLCLTTKFP